jgi:hypothetical protein
VDLHIHVHAIEVLKDVHNNAWDDALVMGVI